MNAKSYTVGNVSNSEPATMAVKHQPSMEQVNKTLPSIFLSTYTSVLTLQQPWYSTTASTLGTNSILKS